MPLENSSGAKQEVRGIIWDLDNTLYRFEEDFEHFCHVAAARAALKGGLDKTFDQAFELCLKSYSVYGHSCQIFTEEYRIDKTQLHFDFHNYIDEKIIARSIELVNLFEELSLNHVLVTHASHEWAQRALTHLGLKDHFPDQMIIPAEATGFERKSESKIPFEMAIQKLSCPPACLVVVEDIAENLAIPYEMGLFTVLVHHGRKPEMLPSYINMACNNAVEFMEYLKNSPSL
jgi:putative hydrolase of the HAD superfamily